MSYVIHTMLWRSRGVGKFRRALWYNMLKVKLKKNKFAY